MISIKKKNIKTFIFKTHYLYFKNTPPQFYKPNTNLNLTNIQKQFNLQ